MKIELEQGTTTVVIKSDNESTTDAIDHIKSALSALGYHGLDQYFVEEDWSEVSKIEELEKEIEDLEATISRLEFNNKSALEQNVQLKAELEKHNVYVKAEI